jgi:soluble lytic murein transglycosylase
LALGIAEYEQQHYSAAITALAPLPVKLPAIADYAAYYLAAARVEAKDYGSVSADLAYAHRSSPLNGKSWILEARAKKASDAAGAVRLLNDHYREIPQPEGDVTLGDCYQAAGDLGHAAEAYQRVYYRYLTGAAATRSAAALLALRDAMGTAYPEASAALRLQRAGRLLDAKEFAQARKEYESVAAQASGLERDQARVRAVAVEYLEGKTANAWPLLRALEAGAGEAAAERLYYLAECARRRNDDAEMLAALGELNGRYRYSEWRLKTLMSVASRYLLVNRAEEYLPLYKSIYEDFSRTPFAPISHWKVAFQAYLHDGSEAAGLLREHLEKFGSHSSAGAALYFLGRHFERVGDSASANACYRRLSSALENHYYAMLARQRLMGATSKAAAPAELLRFLAGIRFAAPSAVPSEANATTQTRVARSRMLRAAGLDDLADSELRFGSKNDCEPAWVAMELAGSAETPHQAMRIMKSLSPEYLDLPTSAAPRKFWELLFPMPYRDDLVQMARLREIDPYLLAGLIRQESEFNPKAISRAKAYGLTQVRPGTGRLYARKAGVARFTTNALYQPGVNLKIGSEILRSMLEREGGKVEQTLASYNAGPHRVVEWMAWNTYREPAEFVESIPFTETRDYVQAVLRNAEMYRRLYQ